MIPGSIQKLDSSHFLETFDCGHSALNEYLSTYALINQKLNIAQVYVALSASERVIGFYTLSAGAVQKEEVPKNLGRGLPRYAIPVMLLGRLAVDLSCQNQGVGAGLLKDALLRTHEVSKIIGIRAVLVHAKNREVAAWYRRFDFEPSPLEERYLFLSLKDLNQALSKSSSKVA